MATVIEFSRFRQTKNPTMTQLPPTPVETNAGQALAPVRDAERTTIQQAVSRTKKFKRGQDAATVAARLGEVLERAAAQGIPKTRVLQAGWPGARLKDLDKITVPPSSQGASASRLGRLQKGPGNYARVGMAAARLLRMDVDDMLLHLFRGTSVDAVNEELCLRVLHEPEAEECWGLLSRQISEMVAWVIRGARLNDHVVRAAATRGRYDLAADKLLPASIVLFQHGPLANNFESYDEFPPVPSVLIHEDELAHFRRGTLRLLSPEGSAEAIKVNVRIVRELRLAIGPVDLLTEAGPLFEVRTRVDVAAEGNPIRLLRPWLYLDGTEAVDVLWNGVVRSAVLDFEPEPEHEAEADQLRVPLDGAGEGLNGGPLQPEHVYAVWYPITPRTCQRLLMRSANDFQSSVGWPRVRENMATLCLSGTVGAALEGALLSQPCELSETLLAEARRLSALVIDFAAERRLHAVALHEQALQRWSS
ncbi:hypothetical protein JKG68_10705 [Microvirga aerilata]|uniref:Uncharacterized protein n=1 Tax=Microvirga aerilata TaxID=670292 RepID=A0A936ZH35_9HYPH|nr:hypothetical protein [Microvirga aerilata]MBL0404438.1 hypothetical protein [Microvirga aerilata]